MLLMISLVHELDTISHILEKSKNVLCVIIFLSEWTLFIYSICITSFMTHFVVWSSPAPNVPFLCIVPVCSVVLRRFFLFKVPSVFNFAIQRGSWKHDLGDKKYLDRPSVLNQKSWHQSSNCCINNTECWDINSLIKTWRSKMQLHHVELCKQLIFLLLL